MAYRTPVAPAQEGPRPWADETTRRRANRAGRKNTARGDAWHRWRNALRLPWPRWPRPRQAAKGGKRRRAGAGREAGHPRHRWRNALRKPAPRRGGGTKGARGGRRNRRETEGERDGGGGREADPGTGGVTHSGCLPHGGGTGPGGRPSQATTGKRKGGGDGGDGGPERAGGGERHYVAWRGEEHAPAGALSGSPSRPPPVLQSGPAQGGTSVGMASIRGWIPSSS